jgi:hypothetical protein
VVIKTSKYDLGSAAGKVRMEYTFTPAGARSLFEDNLVCHNVGQRIDETGFPDHTLWKSTEEGARGIGNSRLRGLAGECKKIEAYKDDKKIKVKQ